MSKKNNRTTRANAHAFKLAQEKEAEAKRTKKQDKQQKKAERQEQQAAAAAPSVGAATGHKLGVKGKKGIKIKATKNRIKLRKNKVVRGIKIKDAESKKRAKELLAAEEAMREMEMDAAPQGRRGKRANVKFATGEGMDMD